MPRAEVGSLKHLSNKMKSKGLQRLRWYCQVCERQMRDANGFKLHTQSESHVRQMLIVGEDPTKHIGQFSRDFQHDFLQLLKTGHGEKMVHINHFYQEYIANKEHVHMNATKWPSLTEFAKHLGREGVCRVEENEKGIHLAWIDDSPEAMRRREIVRRKEMQDKGDEEREQRMIREQIKRARRDAGKGKGKGDGEDDEEEEGEGHGEKVLKREEGGEKIGFSFGTSSKPSTTAGSANTADTITTATTTPTPTTTTATLEPKPESNTPAPAPVSLKLGTAKSRPKNVFATAKKNALANSSTKKPSPFQQPQKMSEAERIMKEEMERSNNKKRPGPGPGPGGVGFGGFNLGGIKKQRTS